MNKDYIYSEDIREDDNDDDDDDDRQAWGTWEELLLACAVKRHGIGDWDSVATEVRSRSSVVITSFFSANNCREKYRDLKRRFQRSENEEGGDKIPWLEQLRNLRVEELRREVQQYDVSILSLQLKVKKLEEERDGEDKPDLGEEEEEERKGDERSEENDCFESERREKPVTPSEKAEEEFERENRSMNESNSTDSGERVGGGDEPSQTRDEDNPDPDPIRTAAEEGSVSRGPEASHSDESGTSENKRKRKRRENKHDGGDGEIRSAASKSQPLISLLDLIRSHPRGSLFERRLRSQESKEYKRLVKQHLDIETIQRKLKKGSYDDSDSSSSLCFYRDLQLLFTNAIAFFPPSSSESMAARELRTVVRKHTGKSREIKMGTETSSETKSSGPLSLVVCNKRRLVSPSSSSFSGKEETTTKEEIVNTRKSNKAVVSVASKGKNKQKQTDSKTNSSNADNNNSNNSKQETGKPEKKKIAVSSDKKKSVADFLKRIKKNSPQKEDKDQNKSGGSGKKDSKSKLKPRELRSNNVGSKKKAQVESSPVKRGRPQKKKVEAGKRSRETGNSGKDDNKQQPKKRSRR